MNLTESIHLFMLIAAVVGTGLVAGIFYAFSTFIMQGLAELSPAEGMRAMQSINNTVLTRWFLWVFMGTFGLCLALIFVFFADYRGLRSLFVIVGALSYVVWCFFVTGTRNVPRNNKLASTSSESAEAEGVWRSYLEEWTHYNHIRTGASLVACVCFMIAALMEVSSWA